MSRIRNMETMRKFKVMLNKCNVNNICAQPISYLQNTMKQEQQ